MKKPDIFAYLDHRKYLQDAFAALRAADSKASYRSFAKQAGYTSPNLLQLIIAGKRDLSPSTLPGTSKALGLNRQETDFLAHLAGFGQAESFEEKNFHYQRMLRSRRFSKVKAVEKDQFRYFEEWYHPVVRELLVHPACDGTPAWIAERVRPRITPTQAERSMELLEALGLVRKAASGHWEQMEALLSTPAEVASLAVASYHRSMLRLAADSIEAFGPAERDIRSVTLGIPRNALPGLKARMEEFWRDLLALGNGSGGVEDVVQVNLQLFPVARGNGDKDSSHA